MESMDTTQPPSQDLLESSVDAVDPPRDAASLLTDLETLDPVDTPAVAEHLATMLTEQLDATGRGAVPPHAPSPGSGDEEPAR
jgi:hypothetical protein